MHAAGAAALKIMHVYLDLVICYICVWVICTTFQHTYTIAQTLLFTTCHHDPTRVDFLPGCLWGPNEMWLTLLGVLRVGGRVCGSFWADELKQDHGASNALGHDIYFAPEISKIRVASHGVFHPTKGVYHIIRLSQTVALGFSALKMFRSRSTTDLPRSSLLFLLMEQVLGCGDFFGGWHNLWLGVLLIFRSRNLERNPIRKRLKHWRSKIPQNPMATTGDGGCVPALYGVWVIVLETEGLCWETPA